MEKCLSIWCSSTTRADRDCLATFGNKCKLVNSDQSVFFISFSHTYLSVVNFLFHGSLGQEPIDVDRFVLAKAVDTEDGLHVVSYNMKTVIKMQLVDKYQCSVRL